MWSSHPQYLLDTLPLEFTYDFILQNRYNMPQLQHKNFNYEILCSNGFVKLYTKNGRAYWIAQLENNYRTPDWKFHISIPKDQIPKAWDIIAKLFIEMQCKSGMKAIFTKDSAYVSKGREITIYIYRYQLCYGEGLRYKLDGNEVLIKLTKNMEQTGSFWMKFIGIVEQELQKAGIETNGCANGDRKIGNYTSIRNESFVMHDNKLNNGIIISEYEYPRDEDGWNGAGHELPFELEKVKKRKYLKVIVVSIIVSILFYFFKKNFY